MEFRGRLSLDGDAAPAMARPAALLDSGERAVGGRERLLDVVFRVRGGNESRLIGARREVDTGLEHPVKEAIEALLVTSHHLPVRLRHGLRKIDSEHAADRLR